MTADSAVNETVDLSAVLPAVKQEPRDAVSEEMQASDPLFWTSCLSDQQVCTFTADCEPHNCQTEASSNSVDTVEGNDEDIVKHEDDDDDDDDELSKLLSSNSSNVYQQLCSLYRNTFSGTGEAVNARPIDGTQGQTRTRVKSYVCDICSKAFGRAHHLREHQCVHTGVRPYKCLNCSRTFSYRSNRSRHRCTHAADSPSSPTFPSSKHNRAQLPDSPNPDPGTNSSGSIQQTENSAPQIYVADLSGSDQEMFSGSRDIRETGNRGRKVCKDVVTHVCDVCSKVFNRRAYLLEHKRTHTGDRPHKCDICEKAFTCHSHLSRHRRIHTGERPHVCDICHKGFVEMGALRRHQIVHASGDKPYPYKCHLCGVEFSRHSNLMQHQTIHSDVMTH